MSYNLGNHNNENEYDPSSSDDDYDENEKRLLEKFKNSSQDNSDSEREVFSVGVESENDSNNSDIALSDVEREDDYDDLPDVRAWGKEKKKYYGADYVDEDYGGFQGKDAEAAEIEEEEAKNLQTQLIQQLDDNDFAFDTIFTKKDEEPEEGVEQILKTGIATLSEKEKLEILHKESPEMFGLIGDFECKMIIIRDYLYPVIQKHQNGDIPRTKAVEFVENHYQLICNYLGNIYMYLLLKNSKQLKNHPVIKRLYQYRQLIAQLGPVFDEIIKPQIEVLLQEKVEPLEEIKGTTTKEKNKKSRKSSENVEPPNKKLRAEKSSAKNKHVTFELEESGLKEHVEDVEKEAEDTGKRAITYQIAKNKGLTPHRKKEFRNPRVKHKLKYRKAIIRRKGAVREPRKELTRYGGEISGIKAYVSKSIKFKS
ncbi:something about silencing protein 10 [Cylas formicarius]|uniref:something about silencing protein 10 n=1 Tax=Cylas formicarius TaxID=197179 RepID=UPI002958D318|nr:something about silencing protein 10 [Cylas formicarius]